MKIAVYGDSFACCNLINIPGDNLDRGKSWVEVLEEKYTITNFSKTASSLFYSYDLFLKNNKDFDYNIFLVTEPNRLTLNNVDDDSVLKHINVSVLDFFKKSTELDNNANYLKIINGIEMYYTYIHNQKQTDICHSLLVDNITKINPNTLIVPCFENSTPGKSLYKKSLSYISDNEIFTGLMALKDKGYERWKLIDDKWSFSDYRKCHLSEENNKILADNIINSINNKETLLDININDYQKITKDFEFYFMKRTLGYNGIKESRFNGELDNLFN